MPRSHDGPTAEEEKEEQEKAEGGFFRSPSSMLLPGRVSQVDVKLQAAAVSIIIDFFLQGGGYRHGHEDAGDGGARWP